MKCITLLITYLLNLHLIKFPIIVSLNTLLVTGLMIISLTLFATYISFKRVKLKI